MNSCAHYDVLDCLYNYNLYTLTYVTFINRETLIFKANNLVGEHVASEIRTSILRLSGDVGTMFDLDDQQM